MKVKIGRYKKNEKQKIRIKIDDFDVWNLDFTMALILLPMFKRLRKIKAGANAVSDDDVPDELKSTAAPTDEYGVDENFYKRYEWVLSEIIWGLKQLQPPKRFGTSYEPARMRNAFRLMGTYWHTFWY